MLCKQCNMSVFTQAHSSNCAPQQHRGTLEPLTWPGRAGGTADPACMPCGVSSLPSLSCTAGPSYSLGMLQRHKRTWKGNSHRRDAEPGKPNSSDTAGPKESTPCLQKARADRHSSRENSILISDTTAANGEER